MAKLQEIATLLDIKIDSRGEAPSPSSRTQTKAQGKKRRAWIADENDSVQQTDKNNQKGSIDGVYKPRSSTPSINPVHQPLKEKGSIKEAHRPLLIGLEHLRGNPLRILLLFYALSKQETDKITKKITFSEIGKNLDISRDSIKTGLRFLIRNGLVSRVELKVGKAGWSKYKIEENLMGKVKIAMQKGSIDPLPQKGSNSSSSYFNKTTTTKDWSEINISGLECIGFTRKHLEQVQKLGIGSVQEVQNSIEYFAFDLKENGKQNEIKTNALNYFMGILKRSGMYLAPENYEDPKDRAMRIYLEQQKTVQKKREAMENEMLEMAFSEWKGQLSEKEKNDILPEDIRQIKLSGAKESHLRRYFRENQWPLEREKKLTEIDNLRKN